MDSALLIHRLHFAFTVTYHYLFPQLTMGLAPLIVILKTLALKTKDERYDRAARFWAKIFGINFVIGVVTGIPMEFQFGTNWSHFSRFAGGVIGQTLAMEGLFAFFLESDISGIVSLRREAPEQRDALVLGADGVPGLVAVGLLHYRHGCLDAASGGLRAGRGRIVAAEQLLAAGTESVGVVAVRAQHERRRHHRHLCDDRGGRVLPAEREACRAGPYLRAGRGNCFAVRQPVPDHPDGRRAGTHAGAQSTGNAGRNGSLVGDAAGSAAGHPGSARCGGAEDRQPAGRAQDAELSYLAQLERRGQRSEFRSQSKTGRKTFRCCTTPTTSWSGWGPSLSQ